MKNSGLAEIYLLCAIPVLINDDAEQLVVLGWTRNTREVVTRDNRAVAAIEAGMYVASGFIIAACAACFFFFFFLWPCPPRAAVPNFPRGRQAQRSND
jgi:hypothetical protein